MKKELTERLKERGIHLISPTRAMVTLRAETPRIHLAEPATPTPPSAPAEPTEQTPGLPAEPAAQVRAVFRAISMAAFMADTAHHAAMLDFTRPGVLEAAAGLLAGKTVYPDHDHSAGAWLGHIERSWWSVGDAPAVACPGINAELVLDRAADPKIIAGVERVPPTVKAGSVAVDFDFEASHTNLDPWEFWELQGSEVAGNVVRCIVTQVYGFGEYSLVWAGADPSAVKLSKEGPRSEDRGSRAGDHDGPDKGQGGKTTMKLSAEMAARVRAYLGARAPWDLESNESGSELALDALLKHGDGMAAELAKIKPDAEFGKTQLAELRAEATRLATVAELGSEKGELSALTKKSIELASFDELKTMAADLGKKVDLAAPARCAECGSTKIERRSSQPADLAASEHAAGFAMPDPVAEGYAARYAKK